MPGDTVDRQTDELLAVEHDRTHSLADDTHDRLQGRRLSRSVSPEQRHDLALPHVEIDAVQNMRFIVPGLQAFDVEHRLIRRGRTLRDSRLSHAPPRDRPASPLRSRTPRDSRPRQARAPRVSTVMRCERLATTWRLCSTMRIVRFADTRRMRSAVRSMSSWPIPAIGSSSSIISGSTASVVASSRARLRP